MNLEDIRLGESLGGDGIGAVRAAVWLSPEREVPVVVKRLSERAAAGQAAHHFVTAAHALARLSHPNIVTVLATGYTDGLPYLVREWVPNTTLLEAPPESWEELSPILEQLLGALGYAHAWGVLHLELAPDNVLIDDNGVSRLTDFGDGRIAPNPSYAAPEQVVPDIRELGAWTDIYGLGTLAWQLLTGKPLFEGEPRDILFAHVQTRPPRLDATFAVPPGLQNWLRTALEKQPRNRFQSAAEALAALGDLQDTKRTSRYPVLTPGNDAGSVATVLSVPQRCANEDHPLPVDLRIAASGLIAVRRPPLFGRTTEKELLWNALRRVSRLHRAEAAIVCGAPGSGKSALVEWLERRMLQGGHGAVLRCRGDSPADAVLRYLDVDPSQRDAHQRLATGLQRLGFEEPEVAAANVLDPGGIERAGWHDLLLEFAARTEGGNPAIWVIEDAEWSIALEEFVAAAAAAQSPLFVVVTTTEQQTPAIRRSFRIDLGLVSDATIRQLVHSLFPLAPTLTDTVVDAAAGRPMYVRQLLIHWATSALLHRGPLGYQLHSRDLERLPTSSAEIWRTRLETAVAAAGPSAADALNLAALFGPQFPRSKWLLGCAQLDLAGDVELQRLSPFGLLHSERNTVQFVHPTLRQIVLEQVRDRDRYAQAVDSSG